MRSLDEEYRDNPLNRRYLHGEGPYTVKPVSGREVQGEDTEVHPKSILPYEN